ncbi:MAG: hypothetical protein KIH01_00905 [Candidatus Freyarchaeota archaeon]|nr:hypothetical protein [Candidatus Jordarchaeia archaeon]
MLVSPTRACRDAVAFSASLNAPFAEPIRKVFLESFNRKFGYGETILPAYEARRHIDIFYMGKMAALTARLLRLLQVPAELPRLIREVIKVPDGEAEKITRMFLESAGGLITSNGSLTATITSSNLIKGEHDDWKDARALYDLILHMPPGVNVNLVLRISCRILSNPRKVLKELYDNRIIYLQGVGKETLVWTALPPPRNCSAALQELRRRGLQDAALYLLRNPLRAHPNGASDIRIKEAFSVLVASGVTSSSFKTIPLNSLFLEAALSEVYPLTGLVPNGKNDEEGRISVYLGNEAGCLLSASRKN